MSAKSSVYIPFARKYRSTNFSELTGQEVLVKTLSYCIKNNRLAHAYLLTGIRGVGKTSSARIIAKTVNCTALQVDGQQVSPCLQCANCKACAEQNHPDIVEIDAASRTGIDDIREIIESSEYRPLLGAYKFFIIDEIHMLSKSAFNALLKVIEEPPLHVIFIFATTEVQKIPLTIISRCQRYDLRRLSVDELCSLMRHIVQEENISCTEEAMNIIAVNSEGSARDAVSMLDRAASYLHQQGSTNITPELVSDMLGLLRIDVIIEFTELIIANAPARAIKLSESIYTAGNPEYFIRSLADFIAELSKIKVIPGYRNSLYDNYLERITNILIGTSLSRLTVLWQIFSNGLQEVKQSHSELLTVQMLIIKAIHACNIPHIEDIFDADKAITQTKVENKKDIFDFLKFCHQNKESDIYYLMLNEVEILEFDESRINIAAENKITNEQSEKIKRLMSNWSGNDPVISIQVKEGMLTLKEKMLEKVRLSEDYQIIKNNFPDANISDIILNNSKLTR